MEQQELYLMLGRIDSKLDALSEKLLAHVADDDKLADRVTKLETRVNLWAGGLAVFVFVLTTFGAQIVELIRGI